MHTYFRTWKSIRINCEFVHNYVNICYLQPQLPAEAEYVDYDSADSAISDLDDEEEEDVFDGTTTATNTKGPDKENTEHSNPSSYSWCVMRLAIMKLVQHQLQDFLSVAGIEIQGEKFISVRSSHGRKCEGGCYLGCCSM
jgi:hypothetical protein